MISGDQSKGAENLVSAPDQPNAWEALSLVSLIHRMEKSGLPLCPRLTGRINEVMYLQAPSVTFPEICRHIGRPSGAGGP